VLLVVVGGALGYASLFLVLVLGAAYAWMLFAFLHYRHCRQEELLGVISAAAEAQAPLAPALWAYLRDRPHDSLRELWVALILNCVMPGYYWLWYRRSNYDHKVEQLAVLLEAGASLNDALCLTPRVASPTMRLAVRLGEDTGQLALCLNALHSPPRRRLTTVWLELVPRAVYPVLLLFVITGILSFWSVFLLPKFQRIFQDFHMKLPQETDRVMTISELLHDWFWLVAPVGLAAVATLILLLLSPGFRWYFPVVGRYYKIYVRSQILQALAFLLRVQKPVPAALSLLAESGAFPGVARRRLRAVRRRIEAGEPLAESLNRGHIIPGAVVPLVRTAARAGNLAWALGELADVLAQRAVRRVQRLGILLSPLPVVGLGVLVGFIVLGLYAPLIYLIEGVVQ
jgi:type IV pilus assembly protein PilC